MDQTRTPLARRVLAEIRREEQRSARKRAIWRAAGATAVLVAAAVLMRTQMGAGERDPDRTRWLEQAQSRSAGSRGDAYVQLGMLLLEQPDAAVRAALLNGLHDVEPHARTRAFLALATSLAGEDGPRVVREMIGALHPELEVEVATDDSVYELLEQVTTLTEEQQIVCVLRLLESFDAQEAAPYTDFVTSSAAHPLSPAIRAQALRTARVVVPGWSEIPALVKAFLEAGTTDERVAAMQALDDLGLVEFGPMVRDLLADADKDVRVHAAYTVARLQDKEAVPALIELTTDPEPQVQVAAAYMLARLGDKSYLDVVANWADGTWSDPSGDTGARESALRALSRLGDPRAATAAEQLVKQWPESGGSRILTLLAIEVLGEQSGTVGVDILHSMLQEFDPFIVISSAAALHRLQSPEGKPVLLKYISGTEYPSHVRQHAIRAAEMLGDLSFKPPLEVVEQEDADPDNREAASRAIETIEEASGD